MLAPTTMGFSIGEAWYYRFRLVNFIIESLQRFWVMLWSIWLLLQKKSFEEKAGSLRRRLSASSKELNPEEGEYFSDEIDQRKCADYDG
jgi:hypothetical protein